MTEATTYMNNSSYQLGTDETFFYGFEDGLGAHLLSESEQKQFADFLNQLSSDSASGASVLTYQQLPSAANYSGGSFTDPSLPLALPTANATATPAFPQQVSAGRWATQPIPAQNLGHYAQNGQLVSAVPFLSNDRMSIVIPTSTSQDRHSKPAHFQRNLSQHHSPSPQKPPPSSTVSSSSHAIYSQDENPPSSSARRFSHLSSGGYPILDTSRRVSGVRSGTSSTTPNQGMQVPFHSSSSASTSSLHQNHTAGPKSAHTSFSAQHVPGPTHKQQSPHPRRHSTAGVEHTLVQQPSSQTFHLPQGGQPEGPSQTAPVVNQRSPTGGSQLSTPIPSFPPPARKRKASTTVEASSKVNTKRRASVISQGSSGSASSQTPGGTGTFMAVDPSGSDAKARADANNAKKSGKQLLTEEEKRANHIESEKKRRQNIRTGFDQLVEIVPTLSQCHRSEALILQKAVEYVQYLLRQKSDLQARVSHMRNVLAEPDYTQPYPASQYVPAQTYAITTDDSLHGGSASASGYVLGAPPPTGNYSNSQSLYPMAVHAVSMQPYPAHPSRPPPPVAGG
ncbi:hypothetical protein SpCBS45565_g01759 [Spizellomyces sp. 'palustris']|nr:hypothetical protein SpCBS45565_g01759 [Spizellomyces sp. 'palustris']